MEPTETERREMNERLARAMGWTNTRWHSTDAENPAVSARYFLGATFAAGTDPGGNHFMPLPDFTRDPAASRELVLWVAVQDRKLWPRFKAYLRQEWYKTPKGTEWERWLLTADPLLIAIAVAQAIGGNDER